MGLLCSRCAFGLLDSAIFCRVDTQVIHRFGEICTQHPLVLVDFSPLGELKCPAPGIESCVDLAEKRV